MTVTSSVDPASTAAATSALAASSAFPQAWVIATARSLVSPPPPPRSTLTRRPSLGEKEVDKVSCFFCFRRSSPPLSLSLPLKKKGKEKKTHRRCSR